MFCLTTNGFETQEGVDLPTTHHDHKQSDSIIMNKSEIRKSNKPIMEKRRRARINTCLDELKSLILDALKKDPSRHNKLEKADILEMTVKHLQVVQRQQLATAVASDPSVLEKFKGGFADCAQEITRYISRVEGVDGGLRQRLVQHLCNCTKNLVASTPLSFTALAGVPVTFRNQSPTRNPQVLQQGDLNNNNNHERFIHKLVAARLAAAGDTVGASMVLQGGFLFDRGTPGNYSGCHATPTMTSRKVIQDQQKSILKPVNEGASISGESGVRVSAFTAVKRSLSPKKGIGSSENQPKLNFNSVQQNAKVLTPMAIRPHPVPEKSTLVKAEVSLQPVKGFYNPNVGYNLPASFSVRGRLGNKRQNEDSTDSPRPFKVLVKSEESPHSSQSSEERNYELPSLRNLKTQRTEEIPLNKNSSNSSKELNTSTSSVSSHNNSNSPNSDVDDKDMWRPW